MANIKIKFIVNGEEREGEIPEADFANYEKAYKAKKVGGSAPKKAVKAELKEEPKKSKKK
jgi:hypothetical protein|tara:strand:+ start:392 stop:571 length:180 start_codon:yes stop_codon:yes gene_type:complete